MLTRNDLLDILFEQFAKNACVPGAVKTAAVSPAPRQTAPLPLPEPAGGAPRIFFSDWELRRMRKPGAKTIAVPRGAIISPLARDWIDYEGIEIVFS